MQGIDSFGDFAIVLQDEADDQAGHAIRHQAARLMMIKKAFDENGIKIAVPTVHVEGGGQNVAAAQEVLNMKQAADLAANPAAV